MSEQGVDLLRRELIVLRDDQYVHITSLVLLAARKRTENEGDGNVATDAVQHVAQAVAQADGADDDLLQGFIYG